MRILDLVCREQVIARTMSLCTYHDNDMDLRGIPLVQPDAGCRCCRAQHRVSEEAEMAYDEAILNRELLEVGNLGVMRLDSNSYSAHYLVILMAGDWPENRRLREVCQDDSPFSWSVSDLDTNAKIVRVSHD